MLIQMSSLFAVLALRVIVAGSGLASNHVTSVVIYDESLCYFERRVSAASWRCAKLNGDEPLKNDCLFRLARNCRGVV